MNPTSVLTPLALRPREAARALGISPRLLWQLTKDGHIPCVRVGSGKRRSVLYPLAELQAWLTRRAVALVHDEINAIDARRCRREVGSCS
jgi:excisionase family DNA binding protein